jgi:hypothetical protein
MRWYLQSAGGGKCCQTRILQAAVQPPIILPVITPEHSRLASLPSSKIELEQKGWWCLKLCKP